MIDWAAIAFLVLWGVIAVFLGVGFATNPEAVESVYRRSINRTKLTKRLGERFAPRERVLTFYRIGGISFAVLGVIALIVVIIVAIGFAIGFFR